MSSSSQQCHVLVIHPLCQSTHQLSSLMPNFAKRKLEAHCFGHPSGVCFNDNLFFPLISRRAANKGYEHESVGRNFRESKAVPVPDANAEFQATMRRQGQCNSKCTIEKYNPQEDGHYGFHHEPAKSRALNVLSHSGQLMHPIAVRGDSLLDMSGDFSVNSQWPEDQFGMRYSHQADGESNKLLDGLKSSQKKDFHPVDKDCTKGYANKNARMHHSGPLLAPEDNREEMLKEHERQIQQAVRKVRLGKDKTKNADSENGLTESLFQHVKSIPFSGTGKHKYSFQNIKVPPLPVHFCDCEEHCKPFVPEREKLSIDRAAESGGINDEEISIMNAVVNKLFGKEQVSNAKNLGEEKDSFESPDALHSDECEDSATDEDDLIINVETKKNKTALTENKELQRILENQNLAKVLEVEANKQRATQGKKNVIVPALDNAAIVHQEHGAELGLVRYETANLFLPLVTVATPVFEMWEGLHWAGASSDGAIWHLQEGQ
ncbi:putative serine/threonine-protein kinase [Glycine soja]|uniref:Putative serine/threonine-protein kinase n=1 Tax=Glycine soja TaxID=3848 RepID=A0A445H4L2_GLYSO|nr:putative serine/threonine-protein kinase [Glycine soja]